MNKKFLSAILFGALMVTSTGTFVSCKDYDDDIKDLQTQINSNKDAIAALQKLVGEGNWVTGITSIADGFTVTMSNGQTTTITAIKGADGKDGVEWTIGEDGFWYKDGEKTEHQAVAKDGEDGKPGVTAPSPSISADGKWVVYEWDATKGEFVATTTEIPAQGTSAYVVKKDGVYVLHIADETGAFQDVTLPATSDSFVVEAPAAEANVWFETATWSPSTTNKAYQMIVQKFPEVAEIAKNTVMKQGGHLPVLVNPASVELTNDYSFSLQTYNGKTPDIAVANPQKGLIGVDLVRNGVISTRSAKATDNYWTLQVEPAYNTKTKSFESAVAAALVVENVKGTVVKSAFAYNIKSMKVDNVAIYGNQGGYYTNSGNTVYTTAAYASSIDLFASFVNASGNVVAAPIAFDYNYIGYYIIEIDALDKEKYDLSLAEDGHTLNVGNMPTDRQNITVTLTVTVLGLNGSAITNNVRVNIGQEMVAAGELKDKLVTLGVDEKTGYDQDVLWDIADLQLTATQLDQLMNANDCSVEITWVDEDGNEHKMTNYQFLRRKADGVSNATKYSDLAKIGFVLNASEFAEREYTVLLKFANWDNSGQTIVFSAEATMNVVNPTDIFYLAKAYADNGVLTVVGNYNEAPYITYVLKNGVVAPTYAQLESFEDYDHSVWLESLGTETEPGAENWVIKNYDDEWTLRIFKNGASVNGVEQRPMLYEKRNIRATYSLFGNAENKVTYDFPVIVKSAIYSEDPSKVIVLDEEGLTAEFGGDAIDIRYAISGVYAAGINKDKSYGLFDLSTPKKNTYKNYGDFKTSVSNNIHYVLGASGLMIQVALADMSDFGFSAGEILNAQEKGTKYYVVADGTTAASYNNVKTWDEIVNVALTKYYDRVNGTGTNAGKIGYRRNATKIAATDATIMRLFEAYKDKVNVSSITEADDTTVLGTKAAEIEKVELTWANENDALKYVEESSDIENGEIIPLDDVRKADLVEGKATVAVKLTVTDKWGMVMTHTINVTLVAPAED